MAPLKLGRVPGVLVPGRVYPWLKCHGSIEAALAGQGCTVARHLSMAKMPWLH